MNKSDSFVYHFPARGSDDESSPPARAPRRPQPTTASMPKVTPEVLAAADADAPLAPPRRQDSGLAARPSHVEMVVSPHELEEHGGATYLRRLAGALAESPGVVVVNLLSGPALSEQAVGRLLRTRADAQRAGARFVLRPLNPAVRGRLQVLGVAELLGIPS